MLHFIHSFYAYRNFAVFTLIYINHGVHSVTNLIISGAQFMANFAAASSPSHTHNILQNIYTL